QRTDPVLFLPERQEASFSGQVPFHFHVEAFLKVRFPGRIKWVGCSPYERMPLDFHIDCSSSMHQLRASILLFDLSCKHPVSCPLRREVFLLHPGRAFSWVSPSGPPPQLFKDCMIHRVKGFTAGPKSMVVGPPPDNRIEFHHDLSRRAILMFFDDPSDLLEERFHVLF